VEVNKTDKDEPASESSVAGYYRDAIGQDYAMARYYNANTGAFFSQDPGGMRTASAGNPGTWNRYSYTTGDPVNFNDPTGKLLAWTGDGDDGGGDDPCLDDWTLCYLYPYQHTGGQSGRGGGGGGGGGDYMYVPLTGNSFKAAQLAQLTAGFASALQHVDDTPCASLFAKGADNAVYVADIALLATTYWAEPLPQGPGAGAQTVNQDTVFLNTAGQFFNYTTAAERHRDGNAAES
jgi:RHS repeat-associated protein